MEMIDGYGIQKAIVFETGHGIALGCTLEAPERFAVWNFTEAAYRRDYYWKKCFESRGDAEGLFRHRADCYREIHKVPEMTEHSKRKYYRYYSTQRPVDIATYPKPPGNVPLVIVNYDGDGRRPVAGGLLSAWGELVYQRPLTQEQAEEYELTPAPLPPHGKARKTGCPGQPSDQPRENGGTGKEGKELWTGKESS